MIVVPVTESGVASRVSSEEREAKRSGKAPQQNRDGQKILVLRRFLSYLIGSVLMGTNCSYLVLLIAVEAHPSPSPTVINHSPAAPEVDFDPLPALSA